MIVSGWRLARPNYAKSIKDMMSGKGSYLAGGRWNSQGVYVVYLGNSIAMAAFELLVHLHQRKILNSFKLLQVSFDESLVQDIDINDLPQNWAVSSMSSPVKEFGDAWLADASSLVLRVPSAVVQGEYNYLVNPEHPDVDKLIFGEITSFNYDKRLEATIALE